MTVILINEQSPEEISFDQGGDVIVFDTTLSHGVLREVRVSHGTRLRWYGLSKSTNSYDMRFITESDSQSIIRVLILARSAKADISIHSELIGDKAETNIHILSLVGEEGVIDLDGTVKIQENISKVKGHILEENIFLGSKGSIRGIPSLLVHSDDVEAGHAARIERVSDEKLYYLRARGIPKDDATVMMIQSAVASVFDGLDDQYQEVIMKKVMQIFSNPNTHEFQS